MHLKKKEKEEDGEKEKRLLENWKKRFPTCSRGFQAKMRVFRKLRDVIGYCCCNSLTPPIYRLSALFLPFPAAYFVRDVLRFF